MLQDINFHLLPHYINDLHNQIRVQLKIISYTVTKFCPHKYTSSIPFVCTQNKCEEFLKYPNEFQITGHSV
jgi:hypothetical protein